MNEIFKKNLAFYFYFDIQIKVPRISPSKSRLDLYFSICRQPNIKFSYISIQKFVDSLYFLSSSRSYKNFFFFAYEEFLRFLLLSNQWFLYVTKHSNETAKIGKRRKKVFFRIGYRWSICHLGKRIALTFVPVKGNLLFLREKRWIFPALFFKLESFRDWL